MASAAAVLQVHVELDSRGAVTGLRGVQSSLSKTSKSARTATDHTDRLSKSTRSLGSHLTNAAKYAVGAAAAYIGIAEAKKAVDVTEDLAKATISLHENLGLSVKRASEWSVIARSRDVDSKKLGMAFKTLATQITAARDGSESAKESFKRLGFSQQDIRRGSRDTNFLLMETSDGLAKLGRGADKAAISGKLFGRGWQSIQPVMRDGSKALKEQLAIANKYGATFSGKTVKSIKDLIASQRELKIAQMGLQIQFTKYIAPALIDAGLAVAQFIHQIETGRGAGGKFAQTMMDVWKAVSSVVGAVRAVVNAFGWLHDRLKELATTGGGFEKWLYSLPGAFGAAFGDAIKWVTDLGNKIRSVGTSIGGLAGKVAGVARKGANIAIGIGGNAVDKARDVAGKVRDVASKGASIGLGLASNAVQAAKNVWARVKDIASKLINIDLGLVSAAVAAAKKIWGLVKDVASRAIDIPLKIASGAVAAAKKVWGVINDSLPDIEVAIKFTISGISSAAEKLKGLATGATGFRDFEGGPAIVNERGPEMARFANGVMAMLGKGNKGPELTWLPKGTDVFTAQETKALLAAGVPGFAKGTKGRTKAEKKAHRQAVREHKQIKKAQHAAGPINQATQDALGTIERMEEEVDRLTREFAFPSSEEGEELSASEQDTLITKNRALLKALRAKAVDLTKVASKKLPSPKSAGYSIVKDAVDAAKEALKEIQGSTGSGGKILDVRETLAELHAPEEEGGPAPKPDRDLAALAAAGAEAARLSTLNALLGGQLTSAQQALGVSQAQYGALGGMPSASLPSAAPYAMNMAMAAPNVSVNVASGMEFLKDLIDVRVEQGGRKASRGVGRTPGVAGSLRG